MCGGPLSKQECTETDKATETQRFDTPRMVRPSAGGRLGQKDDDRAGQDECLDTSEDRVLSAGLFPPESTSSESEGDARGNDGKEDSREHDARTGSAASGFTPVPHETTTCGSDEATCGGGQHEASCKDTVAEEQKDIFGIEETLFIFDYDDTLLPSTWLQRQGLRLDSGSKVSSWHREQLNCIADTAIELIGNAKQYGTVVLVTNAERGWIELSCQKFLPALLPLLENVKCVSARTSYETRSVSSPLEWKVRAFENEIRTVYGQETLLCPDRKKNVLSLGDSVHEREALMRATASLPNCHPKSLKFVERPDISQICKQHALVNSCFHRVVHQEGLLDLCIKVT